MILKNKILKKVLHSKLFFVLIFIPIFVQAKINVVTTTTDLKSLVDLVGQDQVESLSIAKGTQDPHSIEAKPSFMSKMRSAQVVFAQGLELEDAWLRPLVEGSKNPKIAIGSDNFVELGSKLDPIGVSTKNITRAEGDVHPLGDPHFQLDPIRMARAAEIIADKLSDLDSEHQVLFKKNAQELKKNLEDKTKNWQSRLQKTNIKEVITYHKSFNYFLSRFGIQSQLQIEPKPGIPPTPKHLAEVIDHIKKNKIRLVLIENYFDHESENKLKSEVDKLNVERVAVSVEGEPQIKTTIDLIEALVQKFEKASR